MKYIKFLLSLLITVSLVLALNSKIGVAPPFAKFLDPFRGFWQNAEKINGFKDEDYKLPGLKDEVKVYFDERLVPHVFTKNDEDLYYMQGYITAKFRLWQMEIQTHNAAGRVSEIVGEKALDIDRMQRRIGMGYGANAAEEYIAKDPESKKLIDAYCNGVNAYIKTLKPKDYPIEYKLLDYKPEPWTPIKVALLLKNMANMLSVFEYDIENANFVAKYGKDEFGKLYPDFIADEDPIIPKGTNWNTSGTSSVDINGNVIADMDTGKLSLHNSKSELFANAIQKPDEITGSNNWAVSGTKTKSGKPILCNDPHLGLSLPSIWYEMHLVSPNINVYGATLPGSPAVIIGFNDSISWGVTNGGRDVRDWYKIKFKDDSRNEYEYNGQWLKAEKKVERYKVRGKADVLDTVIYTKYGPVVFDQNFGTADSKKNLAMSWTAHLPSNEFKTFYNLNRGKNYDDYIKALSTYTCPAQNFVFASRSGDIAIKEQGRFPIRNKGTEQGKYISDGSTAKDDWTSFIPAENNPTVKNPERGFVSSANQHPTDSTYPYYYPGLGVYENYRNRRINKLLAEGKDIDVDFMKKMQTDNFNLNAAEGLPVLLSLLDQTALNTEQKKIVSSLSVWDFYCSPNQVAPIYYEIWWNELRKLLWDEMLDAKVPMKQPSFYVTVGFLKNDSTSQFYDNVSTPQKETRADIVLQAFKKIEEILKKKEFTEVAEPYEVDETYTKGDMKPHDWGTYKDTRVMHLAKIEPFSSMHIYNGGNLGIINATNTTNGPSWRMIVDEGAMKAYVVYPGGESGNPGSAYYDNMVKTWAKGEYFEANFIKHGEDLGAKKLFVTTYKPTGQ
ncbi:MAG: peptidase penicillin amidase [Bacteroidota bacterium]|nr:peptidase penicillin amidase [Bacteroidota bacterium]